MHIKGKVFFGGLFTSDSTAADQIKMFHCKNQFDLESNSCLCFNVNIFIFLFSILWNLLSLKALRSIVLRQGTPPMTFPLDYYAT